MSSGSRSAKYSDPSILILMSWGGEEVCLPGDAISRYGTVQVMQSLPGYAGAQ